MFARILKIVGIGVAFIVGTACKDSPHDCDCFPTEFYTAVAWGANVVPVTTDTAPRAVVHFDLNPGSFFYRYSVAAAPSGTIDSIALYEVAAGDTLPTSATAILCDGVTACAATSGIGRVVAPATVATIQTSLRAYGTQLVFFTTTAQKAAGGAMRGTMYVSP
jgi:hypothetical protein